MTAGERWQIPIHSHRRKRPVLTEPLTGILAYQARRREKTQRECLKEVQREYAERFNAAEDQQQLREVAAEYQRTMALIGIGPDDMRNHGCVVPPAANANPQPAFIPPSRRPRRAGVLMVAAAGFFALGWVYLLIALVSVLTYYPRRAYHRFTGK